MKLFTFILSILTFVSCNNDNEADSFSTQNMIIDITDKVIVPKVNSFTLACDELNNSVLTYINDINTTNLIEAQNKWKNAASLYAELYAFNIGESKKQFYNLKLYNWPTYSIAIENFINNNTSITEEKVSTLSSQAKTLSGIEYLLFNGTNNDINSSFLNSTNRIDYLKYISKSQYDQSNNLVNLWSINGENYRNIFVNNSGSGLNSSLNMLYNGIYNVIATAKITKIGKTAGLENSDIVSLNELQAPYCGYTKELIIKNIKISKKVFFNDDGISLSDNISSITGNEDLNNNLKNKFETVINLLENLDGTLSEAIMNNPNSVKKIHEELNELMIVLAVDVRSILSIIITATDNDGD